DDCPCTPGATTFCYTGSAGTLGVGPCQGGTRTCKSDGLGYGPCTGEVVPVTEDCSTLGVDEDCDGVAGCPGVAFWSKRFGNNTRSAPPQPSTAVDGAGNVLLTGFFDGSVDFGGGPLTSAGWSDIFVVKLDPAGNHLWSKRFGDGLNQHAWATAVDAA